MSEYAAALNDEEGRPGRLRPAIVTFLLVAAAQLWLVSGIGTDIPILDQWDAEGANLYPALVDGTLTWRLFVRAHNEHRIVFTQLWNLGLFVVNGAWDPLVQLFAGVVLRAGCAALLAVVLAGRAGRRSGMGWAVILVVAYLPVLSWHNVLWGFQSSVWFSLGLATAAFAWWAGAEHSRRRLCWAVGCGAAAQFAMGPGLLVPVAVVGWIAVRLLERRGRLGRGLLYEILGVAALLALAALLHRPMPSHAGLAAQGVGKWLLVMARVLAWPHTDLPIAALAMNAPLAVVLFLRLLLPTWRREGDGVVVLLGLWAIAMAGATAWSRGGSWELALGLPSRYVDLAVVLPLVNLWCAFRLADRLGERRRPMARLGGAIFGVFVVVGWLALTAAALRSMIVPRFRDPAAPVRLAIAYQRTWDSAVYDRQPRFYRPHDDLSRVRSVLQDPRLAGKLPPSFQPERPPGLLGRWARWCAEWRTPIALTLVGLAFGAMRWPRDRRRLSGSGREDLTPD